VDRLYTAFVSSTFLDLVGERQAIANALLNDHCVPLGMEFFPSTGVSQWPIIIESIKAADFCLFVVAGRYGSISVEDGISWTQREFREAQRQGKPIIGLLHGDPGRLEDGRKEADQERWRSLMAFRTELEQATVCRYYTDDAEMLVGLLASVGALEREQKIDGWIPAGKKPVFVQETDFNRTYELIEGEWFFLPSSDGLAWDANYTSRRRMRGNDPAGVPRCVVDFSRDTDALMPFTADSHPRLELSSWERSEQGSVELKPPRKRTGATFAQDVQFDPPLNLGEVADFTIKGRLPSYKLAFREDLMTATVDTRLGPRTWDYSSRRIAYPTERLVIRVFLPDRLGATPAGPKIGRAGVVDDGMSSKAAHEGYRSWRGRHEGEPGLYVELTVPNPRLRWTYRLAWHLPPRPID
jgi:Domain of unknown function (DUF4062)